MEKTVRTSPVVQHIAGNATPGNTQPPLIPTDSAMVGHLHREDCEMGREPQEKGQGEDREDLAD
eukprot:9441460-Pyramimonas_sp.AAC.1